MIKDHMSDRVATSGDPEYRLAEGETRCYFPFILEFTTQKFVIKRLAFLVPSFALHCADFIIDHGARLY